MSELCSSRFASLLKAKYVLPLVALCFAVALAFAPLTFTSSTAHASSNNACVSGQPCVTVWATDVNVHNCSLSTGYDFSYPETACPVYGTVAGGNEQIWALCQQPGQTITYDGYTNNYWMVVKADNGQEGFISNIFIAGGQTISGVPFCNY